MNSKILKNRKKCPPTPERTSGQENQAPGTAERPLKPQRNGTLAPGAARGLDEAVTWSFISEAEARRFGGGKPELALSNPIASELSDMRPSLLPGLVAALARNATRQAGRVRLFEVGRTFRRLPGAAGRRLEHVGRLHRAVAPAVLHQPLHQLPALAHAVGADPVGRLFRMPGGRRPAEQALAVLGLFAGILAADPIVDYLAKAFFSMRTAIVTSQESLGWIVEFMTFTNWMVVFGFILLPITYMVFGLPQVLPDHVLKWIGAGIGDLGETDAGRAMRGNMERAALASAGAPPVALPRRGGGGAPGGQKRGCQRYSANHN